MLWAWPQPCDSGWLQILAQRESPQVTLTLQLQVITATLLGLSETLEDALETYVVNLG